MLQRSTVCLEDGMCLCNKKSSGGKYTVTPVDGVEIPISGSFLKSNHFYCVVLEEKSVSWKAQASIFNRKHLGRVKFWQHQPKTTPPLPISGLQSQRCMLLMLVTSRTLTSVSWKEQAESKLNRRYFWGWQHQPPPQYCKRYMKLMLVTSFIHNNYHQLSTIIIIIYKLIK